MRRKLDNRYPGHDFVQHIDGVEVPAGTVQPKPRENLLWPNPEIPGCSTVGGKSLWRHPITMRLTDDPTDLELSPAQLIAKYGTVLQCDDDGDAAE